VVAALSVLVAWRVLSRARASLVGAELLRWLALVLGAAAQMIETTQQHPG